MEDSPIRGLCIARISAGDPRSPRQKVQFLLTTQFPMHF